MTITVTFNLLFFLFLRIYRCIWGVNIPNWASSSFSLANCALFKLFARKVSTFIAPPHTDHLIQLQEWKTLQPIFALIYTTMIQIQSILITLFLWSPEELFRQNLNCQLLQFISINCSFFHQFQWFKLIFGVTCDSFPDFQESFGDDLNCWISVVYFITFRR